MKLPLFSITFILTIGKFIKALGVWRGDYSEPRSTRLEAESTFY